MKRFDMDARKSGRLPALARLMAVLWLAALAPLASARQPDDRPVAGSIESSPARADSEDEDAWNKQQDALLARGDALLQQGQPEAAIREAFDPVIRAHESRYADESTVYYCVRTPAEALAYMVNVAVQNDREGTHRRGVALGSNWAYAYYGKGYALVELNRFDEAAHALDRALELSPHNPQFLTERGVVYRASRDWEKMLESNRNALEFIDIASPDDKRGIERARAMRGQGYALIELERLDEAEQIFRDSLEVDPGNALALDELEYIKQLRKSSK